MATDTKELKALLHESIENIDDEELLLVAKSILDRMYEPDKNVRLNDFQKKRLDMAKKSIQKGDYLTTKQADELVSKWLKE